ncbi:hypothetical protein Ancab_033994 [Ancistrocladus abbreviatus]
MEQERHIEYCMHRVNLLRHYGVKPILVFDGGLLPMKSEQENKRARARKENLARAIEHESNGNSAAAYEYYQKAVDISPAIAYELIKVLRREDVDYVVAPYEADAQMTFLAVNKLVDAVITEDSDLIPFGCPRIIFKMDKFGQGVEFQSHMLQHNKELNFTGFTRQMLLEMCILSGCDYLQSLPGMGLKKAHALTRKFKTFDKQQLSLFQVIKHLRFSTVAIPPLYEESFKKAIWTFQHQRVYDSKIEDIFNIVAKNTLFNLSSKHYFGNTLTSDTLMPQHLVKAIAEGVLDPITKLQFQVEGVLPGPPTGNYYPVKDARAEKKKKLDLPAQKNILTNYFCILVPLSPRNCFPFNFLTSKGFASLEAKRKFRAPRVTSHTDDGSSPGSGEQDCEGMAQKISSSAVSQFDPVNPGDTLLPSDSVDSDFPQKNTRVLDSLFDATTQSPEQTPLKQSGRSIHKPCIVSLERGYNDSSNTITENTGPESKENTFGSSYFQGESKDEEDSGGQNCKIILKSSYIEHRAVSEDGPSKERGKIIVRSSYFLHKSMKANDSNNSNANLIKTGLLNDGACKNTFPESASVGNNCSSVSKLKRKASFGDSDPMERRINKDSQMETSIPGSYSAVDDAPNEVKSKEGKFGCNISHLDHYSDISEKSLEKFASVISSFRYSSSGSRASGLRAPLRDVHNTCPNRSPAVLDVSKFSYVPHNEKAVAQSRRR